MPETESRAFTEQEIRSQFLTLVRGYATYWATIPDKTPIERCEGLAFSMMVALDGNTAGFPAVSLAAAPHPEDKQFRMGEGENWYPAGLVFNNSSLHEEIYAEPNSRAPRNG